MKKITMNDIQYWKFDKPEALRYRGDAFTYGEVYWVIEDYGNKGYYEVQNNYGRKHLSNNINYRWRDVFGGGYNDDAMNEYFTRIL